MAHKAPPSAFQNRLRLSVPCTASCVNRLIPCSEAAASRYRGIALSRQPMPCGWATANQQARKAAAA